MVNGRRRLICGVVHIALICSDHVRLKGMMVPRLSCREQWDDH